MPATNRLIRIMTALTCEPWLIVPRVHFDLTKIAAAHAFGGEMEAAQHAIAQEMKANPVKPERDYQVIDGVAVVNVEGVIGRKFAGVLHSSGVTSVDILQNVLQKIAADPQAKSVLMVYDSPGGIARGVPEAAADIAKLNAIKPVVAYNDGQMDSAAYWLASQSKVIYSTSSAGVGSIGVYQAFLDQSRAFEMQGLRMEVIRSGKNKGMGIEGTSLSDDQKAILQARVDSLGAEFRGAVKAARPWIKDDAMDGREFSAVEGKLNGLIDSIATLEEAFRDAKKLAVA